MEYFREFAVYKESKISSQSESLIHILNCMFSILNFILNQRTTQGPLSQNQDSKRLCSDFSE